MADAPLPLDKFGRFVMEKLRDRPIEFFDLLAHGHWKARSLRSLQAEIAQLGEAEKALLRRAVIRTIDTAVHDFLFAIQEAHDMEQGIELLVNGTNVAEVSDGLQGEPFGADGWQAKFSRFGARDEGDA